MLLQHLSPQIIVFSFQLTDNLLGCFDVLILHQIIGCFINFLFFYLEKRISLDRYLLCRLLLELLIFLFHKIQNRDLHILNRLVGFLGLVSHLGITVKSVQHRIFPELYDISTEYFHLLAFANIHSVYVSSIQWLLIH